MSRHTPRFLLVILAAFTLVLGLAPPAAAAGAGWPSLDLPQLRLAGDPAPDQAADPAADPLVLPGTTPQAGPAESVEPADVLASLTDAADGITSPAPGTGPGGGSSAPPVGVAAEVEEAVAADGTAPVVIRLAEQVDLAAVGVEAVQAASAAAAAAGRSAVTATDAAEIAHATRVGHVTEALQATAEASQPAVTALLDAHGATAVQTFWATNVVTATVDADTLAALADHPAVGAVTLDEEIELELPEPAEVGTPKLPVWSVDQVNAPDVWGEYGTRGDGVVVGIIDTGVDLEHPALFDRWRGHEVGLDAAWHSAVPGFPEPADDHGHGTHVAGSILGAPPGEIVGVAPEAQWIASKGFDSRAFGVPGLLESLEWMLAPGGDPANAPHIVSNSWGSDDSQDATFWDVTEAWVAAGIVPVFSNGNAGPDRGSVGSPASFPHVIGVGATDADDLLASFSSMGPAEWDGVTVQKPEISAPGYEVLSAVPGGGYGLNSGTSMAAPHVSGVVALMLAADPDLTYDEVREILVGSARSRPHMAHLADGYGAGVVDAFEAVTQVAHSGTVTGRVTDPSGEPVAATVRAGEREVDTDPDTGGYLLRLPAGSHQLVVQEYGFAPAAAELTVTVGDQLTQDIALADLPRRDLTGVVTGPDGPIPDARVAVRDAPVDPVRVDAQGRFRLRVAEGEHDLWAAGPGHTAATTPVAVDGDVEVTLALAPLAGPRSGWPEYQNHPARTGQQPDPVFLEALAPAWTTDPNSTLGFASPVIADGRVFLNYTSPFANIDGFFRVFDLTDGEQLWNVRTGPLQRGTPAVADGVVYRGDGSRGGFVAQDAATGEEIWRTDTPGRRTGFTSPAVAGGVVYATTGSTPGRSDTVYALDAATGEEIWSADVGEGVFFGQAVGEGIVVVGSSGGQELVALDAATGEPVWTLPHGDEFVSAPSIADGTVYATTTRPASVGTGPFQGSLLAVDAATGQLRWENDVHGDGQGLVPTVHGDLVIAGARRATGIQAYDRETGAHVWRSPMDLMISALQATGDGYLFGVSHRRVAFALDAADGEVVWEQPLELVGDSTPAFAEGHLVYANQSGVVEAFRLAGDIEGTVTGPDEPVTVRIAETGQETTTDPQTGQFAFGGIVAGDYTLVVDDVYGFEPGQARASVAIGELTEVTIALAASATGGISGVVRDAGGAPVAGATVTLPETPLEPAVTDPDGRYTVPAVVAGSWQVVAEADGHAPHEQTVQIVRDDTVEVDFTLGEFDLAVISDFESYLTDGLTERGFATDRVSFDQIAGNTHRYDAVVVAGTAGDRADDDPARLVALIEEADQTGTSLVFVGGWSLADGSVQALSAATGDPVEYGRDRVTPAPGSRTWLEHPVPHPITASLPAGRTHLFSGIVQGWMNGYSGYTLADQGIDAFGRVGQGIGYQPRTHANNHIVLPVHAPAPSNPPDSDPPWQPAMWELLTDAVGYAADASYGTVSGQVTDAAGEPVAATVTVVDGVGEAAASEDGGYQLLLPPGVHTLRVRFPGADTTEVSVTVPDGGTVVRDVTLADAQLGALTGLVTQVDTGAPVVGATVVAGGQTVTTDRTGRYRFEQLPGGTYQVEVTADGYADRSIADVTVTDGELTTVDISATPVVVLVGDDQGRLAHSLGPDQPVRELGWEVADELAGVEVVILHDPPFISQANFLAALAAFDQAGVSVVFPFDGTTTGTSGFERLVNYTDNPPSRSTRLALEFELRPLADHPIFEGVAVDQPVPLLVGDGGTVRAAHFPEYTGQPLAELAEPGGDPLGFGAAYDIRTEDSVHLLLTGPTATGSTTPLTEWTAETFRIFQNSIRWAAAPEIGTATGVVTDPDGAPLAGAEVLVEGAAWRTTAGPAGEFTLPLPAGTHTVRYRAYGHQDAVREVTIADGETTDASASLPIGEVGTITGRVTSAGGGPLADVPVRALGTPQQTTTGADGEFSLLVEAGDHRVELEAADHLRVIREVTLAAGQTATVDVALAPSPTVGLIGDHGSNGRAFLEDWGYRVEPVGWDSHEQLAALDLVVANLGAGRDDPGAAGLAAFEDTVNRAGVSVLWLDQNNRGAVRDLREYHGYPAERGTGSNDGAVTAVVVEPDHPLVAGLPEEFDLLEPDSNYAFFDGLGGTTVADLATGEHGVRGGAIGFRGRTAGAVDVFLSTMSISTRGRPATRDSAALRWTPEAERVLRNALAFAQDGSGIGAELRGTVRSERDGPVEATVTVAETGREHRSRAADGSVLVPLQPGTWTLTATAFGHEPATTEVTVAPGESRQQELLLPAVQAGSVTGTVTDLAGDPVEGAQVTVLGTPLPVAETGADGGYAVPDVPPGDWTLRFTADGYLTEERPVMVVGGQAASVDLALAEAPAVALVLPNLTATASTSLIDLLEDAGYDLTPVHRDDLLDLADEVGDYDLVIFNGILSFTRHREDFGVALAAAEDAEVPVVIGGHSGSGYPLAQLSEQRGDPELVVNAATTVGLDFVPHAAHPIFAGFPVGEPIQVLTSAETIGPLRQRYSFYEGYSGVTLGDVHDQGTGERLGQTVGYRFSSPGAVQLLLSNLASAPLDGGWPGGSWSADGEQIYLNAIRWAADARPSQLVGVVTGDGEPLPDATVTVVGTGRSVQTATDGSYAVSLSEGEYALEVTAAGFVPATVTVPVPAAGTVTRDIDLAPVPRGEVTGTVRSTDGTPVAGAELAGAGPVPWEATTGADGGFRVLVPEGDYRVTVTAEGFLSPEAAEVTASAGAPAVLDLTVTPIDVGVLGDAFGALTGFLQAQDVGAAQLAWDPDLDVSGLEVLVVNGGQPDRATFESVLAAADAAGGSVIFTGTWAVDRGGIRLLEAHTGRVRVAAQGFGDGPVLLTGHDPTHPLFAGLDADPAELIVAGGYYSTITGYDGRPLAGLEVPRDGADPVTGEAVAWSWRTEQSVELLLSASAVTEAVGPGLGWTEAGQRLVRNAVDWVRDRQLAAPETPRLAAEPPVTIEETIAVSGTASWPAEVTVSVDGAPAVTVPVGVDNSWQAQVPVPIGDSELSAVASNLAGDSPASPPQAVQRWVPEWRVVGGGPARAVTLALDGASPWADPADSAELVVTGADDQVVRREPMRWVFGFYLVNLRQLSGDDLSIHAELEVDGHPLVIPGPAL